MKKSNTQLLMTGFALIIILLTSCNEDRTRYGCECEGTVDANTEVVVNPNNTFSSFSTYDNSNLLNADAACHAEMTIEFRWVDDVEAEKETRPPLNYEFKSLFGWFPANEGMETHYFKDGAIIWKISISEAIDKSKPEGSSYGIDVGWAGTGNENQYQMRGIKCDIHIEYKVYDEYSYNEGC